MGNELYLEQNRTVLPQEARDRIQSFYLVSRPFMRGQSVLDLGAGTGTLAEFMRFDDFIVDEMDFYPRDQTVSHVDLNRPLKVSNKLYQNIVLTHVLEHLDVPYKSLERIRGTFCTTGTVICLAWPDPSFANSKHRPFDATIGHLSPVHIEDVRSFFYSLNIAPLLTGQLCSQPGYEELLAIGRCG